MRSSKKWQCLHRRQSPFCHVSELYTPLPSFRGTVETKVGHLAARAHLFAANLDVNRQSRTAHSSNANSAPFCRRQGALTPSTSGAEQGLNHHTSTNHTLDNHTHTTNIRSVHHAQQQPLPNIVNLQNDINGMTAEGNAIAQSVQAYNGHQQAVTTELSLCTNCPVAQMQLQLAGIQTTLADLMVLSNAQ